MFSAVNLRLPTRWRFAAFYAITGCHGAAHLDVVFLAPDDTQLARGPITIPPAAEPLNVVTSSAVCDGVLIDRPGTYRLQIQYAGEALAERPILVGPGA